VPTGPGALDALPIAGFTPREGEQIKQSSPEIVLEDFRWSSADSMVLNASKPPFSDVRARQAIMKAVDEQQIIDTVLDGKGWYYPGVFMPRDDYYLPEAEVRDLRKRDVAAAKRLLAEAGIAPGTSFEALVNQARESTLDAAQLVKAQLAEVGVGLELKVVDSVTYGRIAWQEHGHTIGFSAISLTVSANTDLPVVHHSAGTQNPSALRDAALDAMIERQAAMTRDAEGRKKSLQDVQRYIINSAHNIVLYGVDSQLLHWKYVREWPQMTVSDESWLTVWLDK
jgi:peptide/nickel transport system substrate-binding protein